MRDDPAGRMALMARCYQGPFGEAPRHLPYRRAAMSFMRWQMQRGVLQPPSAARPGSPWWRAVNERILRDGCEAVALSGNLPGPVSSPTVDHWMAFVDDPTARAWYRAHNGSVVAGYLEHRDLAEAENEAERFFMNVVLCRVLFTHALVAAPRLSLGWLRPLAPLLGDPRLGMTGIFLSLSRVLPDEYPLRDGVESYLDIELGFGRLLDYGVIGPRLQQLYEWSARELGAPGSARVRPRRRADLRVAVRGTRRVWRRRTRCSCGWCTGRSHPRGRSATMADDDRQAKKRKRIQWVQRYLVNPPAKAAVWTGWSRASCSSRPIGRQSGKRRHQRRRHEDRRRHRLGHRRVRPPRRLRAATSKRTPTSGCVCTAAGARRRPTSSTTTIPRRGSTSFRRRSHEAAVRQFGTDLLTIQFEFQD